MLDLIHSLPKVELHLHIEGTFEPELMFEIGQRNDVPLKYKSVEELRAAYKFRNLQEFLDLYYAGADVLLHEQDFHDLTMAYLTKVHAQNVRHADIMFDPQTHTERGVTFDAVIGGIWSALRQGERELGITSSLIMSFVRHLSEESALRTLEDGLRHRDKIVAIGLDSSELGNPPSKFAEAFRRAADAGFRIQAHAGEEGPPAYVWEALDALKVHRIDHGNRCLEDEALVARLRQSQMHMTICPLSNLALCGVPSLDVHPLKRLLEQGLNVSVNSDDPAYFGGYMNENFLAVQEALGLTAEDLHVLAKNAIEAAWMTAERKAELLRELEAWRVATAAKA
jgi:adenosine deaminase